MCNEIGEIMTCQTWIWTEGLSESLDRCSTNRTVFELVWLSLSSLLNDLRPWISPSLSFPWEERDWLTCQFQGLSWQLDGRNNDRPDWDLSGAPWNSIIYIIQTGLTITNARVLHMYYFNNILLIVWNVVWMHVWDKSCNIQY